MKKIYIDIRKYNDTGIGTYITNVVPEVVKRYKGCFFVLISTIEGFEKFKYLNNENVKFLVWHTKPFSLLEQIRFFFIDRNSYFWATSLSHPLFKRKLLITLHDLLQISYEYKSVLSKLKGRIAWLYFYSVSRRSKHIFFVSNFTKNLFFHFFKHYKSSYSVTYLGSSFIRGSSIRNEDFFIVFGSVKWHKNLLLVLSVWRKICLISSTKLYIVGGDITKLESLIKEQKLDKSRVNILGTIDSDELLFYYQNARGLIFPSLYEGFGLPPLEAISSGCLVICSDIEIFRELYGNIPIYFDPKSEDSLLNALQYVLKLSEIERLSIINLGYDLSCQYIWENTILATIDGIDNLP